MDFFPRPFLPHHTYRRGQRPKSNTGDAYLASNRTDTPTAFKMMITDLIVNYTIEEYQFHDAWNCRGGCAKHPLMTGEYLAWCSEIRIGASWGDLVIEEEARNLAAESETERIAREKRIADEEEKRLIAEEINRREIYARDVGMKVRMGLKRTEKVAKRQQPCKWVVGEFAGDECWAHEYTCPKTHNRIIKHTCDRLHPGEEGWCAQWITNPRYKPAGAAVRSFAALR